MENTEKILEFVRKEREKIWKYHREGRYSSYKVFKQFSKHELNAFFILCIEKPVHLSRFLNITFYTLESIINRPSYRHYSIPKKKGGKREIFVPAAKLKTIQKRLNYYLQAYYLFVKPSEVHGFVINPRYMGTYCNIVENARAHVNKKYVLNIDLKDFFPNITAKRVKETFSSAIFGYDDNIATALTLLTTFQGRLPAGAPTSPVISNFICLQLDSELKSFCKLNYLTYTRYADDLTFSADYPIPHDTLLDIICIINKNNFRINEKKLRISTSNRKQTVTGITVNQKVNVDRKLLKKTRAMLHDLTTRGLYAATSRHYKVPEDAKQELNVKFIKRLEGYINFIGQVRGTDDQVYRKMARTFHGLFSEEDTPINQHC